MLGQNISRFLPAKFVDQMQNMLDASSSEAENRAVQVPYENNQSITIKPFLAQDDHCYCLLIPEPHLSNEITGPVSDQVLQTIANELKASRQRFSELESALQTLSTQQDVALQKELLKLI